MSALWLGSSVVNCLPMSILRPSRSRGVTMPALRYQFNSEYYPGIISTVMSQITDNQAMSLGAFLRAMRERLDPAGHGLVAGPRRRTPGLRREEVAQLCGLSVTWYTWIEQGR